jgi:hypothetical protein
MIKLIIAIRNCEKAPKNGKKLLSIADSGITQYIYLSKLFIYVYKTILKLIIAVNSCGNILEIKTFLQDLRQTYKIHADLINLQYCVRSLELCF